MLLTLSRVLLLCCPVKAACGQEVSLHRNIWHVIHISLQALVLQLLESLIIRLA